MIAELSGNTNSPWACIWEGLLSEGYLRLRFKGAYFQEGLFSEGLIIGGNFTFQNGLGLTIKTANTNSPWAYIWEGLLSEGYLRLRFEGLISRRVIFEGPYYRREFYVSKWFGLDNKNS